MHPAAKIILRSLSGIWQIPVLSNILLIIVSLHYASSIISKLPRYNSCSSNITIFHQHEQHPGGSYCSRTKITQIKRHKSIFTKKQKLTLALFVFWVFTDNSDASLSFDNLALFTNWFYR